MVLLDSVVMNPVQTAVIVIDVQNDFCLDEPGNSYFDRQVREVRDDLAPMQAMVVHHLIPFIERVRTAGGPIVYIQSCYHEGQYADMPHLCLEGTQGWELYLHPQTGNERVVRKHVYNTFEDTELENHLIDRQINSLLIGGFTTDRCIRETAYASLRKGFTSVVMRDCVSTAGYKLATAHPHALHEFAAHESIRLIDSINIEFRR